MIGSRRSLRRRSPSLCLASVMDARWSSEPQDGVRLPGGVLKSTCPGSVLDSHASPRSSKIRFDSWPGHLHVSQQRLRERKVSHVQTQLRRTAIFFETMSKRRKGFPSASSFFVGMRPSCWRKSSDAMTSVPAAAANASRNVASRRGAFDGVNRDHYF